MDTSKELIYRLYTQKENNFTTSNEGIFIDLSSGFLEDLIFNSFIFFSNVSIFDCYQTIIEDSLMNEDYEELNKEFSEDEMLDEDDYYFDEEDIYDEEANDYAKNNRRRLY